MITGALMSMSAAAQIPDTPQWRPSFHFTPRAKWMNDPNGLLFHQGTYHLFYQYHPDTALWGPMHWGHATSANLLRWTEHPVALAPDRLGLIFSGSAVVDSDNRSGLGPPGSQPLVAVFTHHDMAAKQAGGDTHERQSLAYSLDEGRTWTKYVGNPVLDNPGRRDFRDPKLRWLPDRQRWLMSLACGDRICFYSAPDLKNWTLDSEFGAGLGAHGGVWECPDLFPLTSTDGRTRWVLLVSLTPGGPNGGSATQYFIGDFDGRRFTPDDTEVRWLDHGPDNYAGVTWSGVDDRALFIGWMSNWTYAGHLPTAPWRGAMTLPRELTLHAGSDGRMRLGARPARETQALLQTAATTLADRSLDAPIDLSTAMAGTEGRFVVRISTPDLRGFTLTLRNDPGDELRIGFDPAGARWWIDRRHSGVVDFHPEFAGRYTSPRLVPGPAASLELWFDNSSVELFADGGLSTLTSLFFARARWRSLTLTPDDRMTLGSLELIPLRDPV